MRMTFLKRALFIAAMSMPVLLHAQSSKPNWQNLDLKTDSVFGISTEKAYDELLKGKKHVPVLVAVIDGGVDIEHEDLKDVIWTNPKEKAGNGKDDDKNGYIDDIHGWDFIGGPKGDEHYDALEVTRQLHILTPLYEHADTTKLSADELVKYHKYLVMKADFDTQVNIAQANVTGITKFEKIGDTLLINMNNPDPNVAGLKKYTPKNPTEARIVTILINNLGDHDYAYFKTTQIESALVHFQTELKYHLNLDFDARNVVGDDYTNSSQRFYGNNDVTGPDAEHGTHVAGIIGANRSNNIGVKGVANDVRIMSVRTVPDGDERDKDVANAIRYAADNGAKVINMSFGKTYSWDKKAVDEAVKYAVSKDVLLVHASGNDNTDLDVETRYPNRIYADGSGVASAWIEVGASNAKDNEYLKANFSCYGKKNVDVFAPGVNINSTIPGSKYQELSGTSMASPVVAGLAALIRSYYPKLTAIQVKEIILKSVTKVNHQVSITGRNSHKVDFADLCNTGGIVNAYNALQLAATY